jgi:hypothetical protein
MRYLSRFSWSDLIEHRVYQKQVNQKQLQVMISKQKKEDEFYLKSVAKKKRIDSIDKKKEKRAINNPGRRSGPASERLVALPKQKAPYSRPNKVTEDSSVSVLDALAM